MSKELKQIPVVGESYHFWDDGKRSPSRHYMAKVTKVISVDDANSVTFDLIDYQDWNNTKCKYDTEIPYTASLKEIWEDTKNAHRNIPGTNFTVGTSDPDGYWLYAKDTDYFVEAIVDGYDENPLWFARTVDGGWFSMDIQSGWQSGRLDVDGSIYEDCIHGKYACYTEEDFKR